MNILEQIEKALKLPKNLGKTFPAIRYFDGREAFCTSDGKYFSDSLEKSLELFKKELE